MTNKRLDYQINDQTVVVRYQQGLLQLTVLTAEIVRVLKNTTVGDYSYAIEGNKQQATDFSVDEQDQQLILTTAALRIEINDDQLIDVFNDAGQPLVLDYRGQRTPLDRDMDEAQAKLASAEGHETDANANAGVGYQEVVKDLAADEVFYGLGDKSGFINKRGYEYDNWNTDDPAPQMENFKSLYKSVPFLLGLKDGVPYGLFFDNTYRSHFDLGKENQHYYFYSVVNGCLDYYIIGGKTLREVIKNYTYLTGRTPLPQKWTLGYQQSRWGYKNAQQIGEIAAKMRQYQLPCDVIHLDIDYMDDFRVFTWDQNKYPQMKQFLADLKAQGIKIVTIIDPGVKQDPGYDIYDAGVRNNFFAKTPEDYNYVNRVWPGDSVYPDFGKTRVQKWWAENHQRLTDIGVSGIWNDMNEPASFIGEIPDEIIFSDHDQPATHGKMHNVYGHNMSKATYTGLKDQQQRRPFVITRAAFAGTQKYSTVWTGDNHSLWAHLQMMIPQLCNLGMSGFAFAGTDIGGFGSDATPELLTRWIEAAIFSPLLRNHSAMGTRHQEPWSFGEPTLSTYRKYLQLRYHLLPYLYDLFAEGEQTGLPILRAMVLDDEQDPRLRNLNDQFMVGDRLLVAPIVTVGQTKRLVYLPAGEWLDFWTGATYQGQQDIVVTVPLDYLPLFVRKNSLLPWHAENRTSVQAAPETKITFRLFGDHGSYQHYQDNGLDFAYQQGEYNLYQVEVDGRQQRIELLQHGYQPVYQEITLETANGQQVFNFDTESGQYVLR